ncbi:MAG TPA: 16S rRNA (cytosine(1402)-N(4))-methyltransferase RsmH [Candidatus Paceibacterota bacterium]
MRTRRSESSSNLVSTHSPTSLGTKHQSVLLHEAVDSLDIHPGETVLDATLGGGGHAQEIVKRLGRSGLFIGFDLDSDAIGRTETRLSDSVARTVLINGNFRDLRQELEERGIKTIDKALFDLGWSSDQLEAGRGFSFMRDEPLLMTFRKDADRSLITAFTIVNEWEEASLADIIFGWGEERYSRRIAKAIIVQRERKPIATSLELADIIRKAVPAAYARGRIHPATRTFQALRIAVNDELGALQKGIRSAWELLKPGGKIAVITFHSIEDRAVKRLFVEFEKKFEGERITKKPLTPAETEIVGNPRARSAKLRVIQKKYENSNKKNKQISTTRTPGHSSI